MSGDVSYNESRNAAGPGYEAEASPDINSTPLGNIKLEHNYAAGESSDINITSLGDINLEHSYAVDGNSVPLLENISLEHNDQAGASPDINSTPLGNIKLEHNYAAGESPDTMRYLESIQLEHNYAAGASPDSKSAPLGDINLEHNYADADIKTIIWYQSEEISDQLYYKTCSDFERRKKNIAALRAHVKCFTPDYPLKKGYVAKLLLDKAKLTQLEVVSKLRALLENRAHNKCINVDILRSCVRYFGTMLKEKEKCLEEEWSSLEQLFLEPFAVHLYMDWENCELQAGAHISGFR